MATYSFTLTLEDSEIIALESLLKYVIGAYGDTESNKSKLNLLISQKACEDILLKVKMSWGKAM